MRPAPQVGPELLRRGLLALIVALVVARPLVPGEDAGRTLFDTGFANQVLTFLWIVAAIGWGAWRAWSQRGTWRGSKVEFGLLAVAALAFLSARDAALFKHAAYLIAWEWLGLFIAFCLVRQLVQTPRENLALLSAVLASGVSLAAFAVYEQVSGPAPAPRLDPTVAQIFIPGADESDAEIEPAPAATTAVAATFARPETLAGYLVLLMPVAAGGLACSARGWRIGAALVILLVGLYLTKVWTAFLVLALVAGGVSLSLAWIRGPGAGPRRWLLPAGVLLASAGIDAAIDWQAVGRTILPKLSAAWSLVGLFPWGGVGPGNFGRAAAGQLPPSPGSVVTPPNFILELAAEYGILALAALLTALVFFFWYTRSIWYTPPPPTAKANDETAVMAAPKRRPEPPWEAYLGGIIGLTLAFMLTLPPPGQADLIREGLVTGCRSLVWFAAFAVLSAVPWTPRAVAGSITAGVAALLLFQLTTGGIAFPSLALPLWVLAAVALNVLPEAGWTWDVSHWAALVLPMPLLAVLGLAYLLFGLYPAVGSQLSVQAARRSYPHWKEIETRWRERIKEAKEPKEKQRATALANNLLMTYIINPLRQAAEEEDPGNPYLWTELAYWRAVRWQLFDTIRPPKEEKWPDDMQTALARDIDECDRKWGEAVRGAVDNDPQGPEGPWIKYVCRTSFFIPRAEGDKLKLQQQRAFAANVLDQVIRTDPTHPRLHFLLGDLFFDAGAAAEARKQVKVAQRLDEETNDPRRKLARWQREKSPVLLFEASSK